MLLLPPPKKGEFSMPKAIVIDDSKAIRLILGKMLIDIGYEVKDACNGREAVEILKGTGPMHLALVDWNMPEMNGLEFVQAIRADHGFDSMQLMMVTTETEAEQIVRALEAGANEYVMKPFTKDVILQKLELLRIAS